MSQLATLKQLRQLEIQAPVNTDRLVASLVPLHNLESLSLIGDTKTSYAGLIRLAELKSLRRLALLSSAIDETNLMHLRKLTGLRELDLTWSNVSEADVAQIQNELPNCKVVR